MARKIVVYGEGFMEYDPDDGFTFEMIYDANGKYLGQNQDNIMDGGSIFLSANIIGGVPCVNGKPIAPLTAEEMTAAIAEDTAIMSMFTRR